jgi:phenylacetate-coenzyme A ligase PaaK-like adenylate-forming protein
MLQAKETESRENGMHVHQAIDSKPPHGHLTSQLTLLGRKKRDAILAGRAENLRAVLKELQRSSPAYAEAFKPFVGKVFTDILEIRELPFTTRQQLIALGPMGAKAADRPAHAYYESTGTTGQPLVGFPDLSDEKAASFAEFLDSWMGLRRSKVKFGLIALAYEMNPTGIRFQLALPHIGVTAIPCGVRSTICPPEKTIELIQKLDPEAIFSRPFELLRFGDVLRERAALEDLGTLKLFFLGEIMSRGKWDRITSLWNSAELFGHYGLTEIDSGLHTCHLGNYHEPENPFVHVEVVDLSTNEPIDTANIWGELVFTTLRPTVSPLIRYRTGDLGKRVRCSCGSHSPAYQIKGRISDGVRFGEIIVFPIDLEDAIFANSNVGNEYLFIVAADGKLKLRLERAYGSELPLTAIGLSVEETIRTTVGVEAQVEVVGYGELADKLGIPNKKSGRFTDLRGVDLGAADEECRVNILDSHAFRGGSGRLLSI